MENKYLKQVALSVSKEFSHFKRQQFQKSKSEIFENSYQIHFYQEMKNYFVDCDLGDYDESMFKCLLEDKDMIIGSLYAYFLKNEYASINTYDDIDDLVNNYNQRYHSDILKQDYEAE